MKKQTKYINQPSLFEDEEKKQAIAGLKIALISRHFAFSIAELKKYSSILNWDNLMRNESIEWVAECLDSLQEKIDWTEVWKLKNIKLDLDFFKKYRSKISFSSIHYSKNIIWSEELITKYGDQFDWSRYLITKPELAKIENLRRFQHKLDWRIISRALPIRFTSEILEEFHENWDWHFLSSNSNLPVSLEFIEKYKANIDFDELSLNKASLPVIIEYPDLELWNWNLIIINKGLIYNEKIFDFIFYHYEKYCYRFLSSFRASIFTTLNFFLRRVFLGSPHEQIFFLNNRFLESFPWKDFCARCKTKVDMQFIEMHKDKLDFTEKAFIERNRGVITNTFINSNLHRFNPDSSAFCRLDISVEIVNKISDKLDWRCLSGNEKMDWSWDFLKANFDNFNLFILAQNQGLYEKLIRTILTKKEIISFLENHTLNHGC